MQKRGTTLEISLRVNGNAVTDDVEPRTLLVHYLREHLGKVGAARKHLHRALELDATYADAIYNLGALEYDAGELVKASEWWRLYLEIDTETEWAKRARAGIAVIDRQLRKFVG